MKKYLIEIVLSSIYLRRVEVADGYGPLQEDALVPVRFQRRGHLSAFPGIEADNAAPCRGTEVRGVRVVVLHLAKDLHRAMEQQLPFLRPARRIGHRKELGKGVRPLVPQAVPKPLVRPPQQLVDNLPVVRRREVAARKPRRYLRRYGYVVINRCHLKMCLFENAAGFEPATCARKCGVFQSPWYSYFAFLHRSNH